MNPKKCKGPSQVLSILGLEFNAIRRNVALPPNKRTKYLSKLRATIQAVFISSNELEKLIGYLTYASYAEPFGRPFLSALTGEVNHLNPRALLC